MNCQRCGQPHDSEAALQIHYEYEHNLPEPAAEMLVGDYGGHS